jgi:hypothetical protein
LAVLFQIVAEERLGNVVTVTEVYRVDPAETFGAAEINRRAGREVRAAAADTSGNALGKRGV